MQTINLERPSVTAINFAGRWLVVDWPTGLTMPLEVRKRQYSLDGLIVLAACRHRDHARKVAKMIREGDLAVQTHHLGGTI